jgi:hypothetical protein
VRSILMEDLGRHIKEIRIVVFASHAAELADTRMSDIVSHVTPS